MTLEQRLRKSLLLADVAVLDETGCDDKTFATLAAEHAARTETLVKAVQCASYARALALELSQQFLNIAHQIDGASFQEGELVHVG